MQAARRTACLLVAIVLLSIAPGYSQNFYSYYLELLAQVRQKNLGYHPYWLRLGHYKKKFFGGYKSQADGALFFLSKEGKENPEKELEATLWGFFYGDLQNPSAQHPRCRFPERFHWLKQMLDIEENKLPPVNCELYNEWKKNLEIESVSFIFASFYVNNPASLFGHTFFKWNRKGTAIDRELIDYGLNFAAVPNTDNALLYGIYGVFGGFPGIYTLFPYYLKVNEYNDWESRDIWEYPLKLSPEAIERMIRHTWELGSTHFDYYYFDENCSYQPLTLLDVVLYEENFSDAFSLYVLPLDTVKLVVREKNLLAGKPKMRPSAYKRFEARFKKLSLEEKEIYYRLFSTYELPPEDLNLPSRIAIMDTLIDDYFFRYYGQSEVPEKKKLAYEKLLRERARLSYFQQEEFTYEEEDPTLSHNSLTWRFSYLSLNQKHGLNLLIRPAMRELTDPPWGYSPFAQIQMFTVEARYLPQERNIPFLDRIILAEVLSLSPYKRYYAKPSWGMYFGFNSLNYKNFTPNLHDKMAFTAIARGGISIGERPITLFIFLEGLNELTTTKPYYLLSPGFSHGILWRPFSKTSFLYEGKINFPLWQEKKPIFLFLAQLTHGLNQSFAIETTYRFWGIFDSGQVRKRNEFLASVKFYF